MRDLYLVPEPGPDTMDELVMRVQAYKRDELVAMVGRGALERAIATGAVTRVLPGIYAGHAHAQSFAVRAHAAQLWAGGDAALAGTAALFAWQLTDEPPARISLAVPAGQRRRSPAWLQVRRLTTRGRTTRRGLLQVAMPAYAIVQGYGDLPPRSRASVVYSAVTKRLVSPGQLRAALDASPRVPLRRQLERRLVAIEAGAESFLEEVSTFDVFNTKEFAHLVRQHEVVHEGELFRLDMYDPVTRTCIEADGKRYHSTPEQHQRDTRRDAILATRGILTVRLTYDDICDRPEWCRMIVREVLRARATGATA